MERSGTVPRVNTFPSDDERFRAVVVEICERYAPRTPAALTDLLRPAFPAVEVREREPLARIDNDQTHVWYVFREGDVVPAADRDRSAHLSGRAAATG